MKMYNLNRRANQRIQIIEEQNSYEFRFRTFNGMLFADVAVNGVDVAKSVRCCPYSLIVPYRHMERKGNFFFSSESGEYPSYKDFGNGCKLFYISYEELDGMRTRWEKLHG